MIDVVLHIGRHKTGTTSLQKLFVDNTDILKRNKIIYPTSFLKGIAHHTIPNKINRQKLKTLKKHEINNRILECKNIIESECSDSSMTYLISSEAFQNCDPSIVRQIFPECIFNVKIVCYFREQVDYFSSAYNQKVHATTYNQTPERYLKMNFKADYYEFAESWSKIFSNYEYRIYDKSQLLCSNILVDFCNRVLGISTDIIYYNNDYNPSLTAYQLSVKKYLNKLIERGAISLEIPSNKIYKNFPTLSFSNDKGEKYIADRNISNAIAKLYKRSNKKFFDKYIPDGSFSNPPKEGAGLEEASIEAVLISLKHASKGGLLSDQEAVKRSFKGYLSKSSQSYDCFYQSVKLNNRYFTITDVLHKIEYAYDNGLPFSFVRCGDGEGNACSVNNLLTHQISSSWQIDRIFNLMFGKEFVPDEKKIRICRGVVKAINNADVLGIPSPQRIPSKDQMEEAEVPSRGHYGLFSLSQHLASRLDTQQIFTSCYAHVEGIELWESLLKNKKVTIITCHAELEGLLGSKLGVNVDKVYKIPVQASSLNVPYKSNHVSIVYENILQGIKEQDVSKTIFVIGAGILGKIYCDYVKSYGGISIDLGSVLDLWCGKAARVYQRATEYRRFDLNVRQPR